MRSPFGRRNPPLPPQIQRSTVRSVRTSRSYSKYHCRGSFVSSVHSPIVCHPYDPTLPTFVRSLTSIFSFKAAKSRSPTRTNDPDFRAQPLHSCLVHREPSSPPLSHPSPPLPRPVRRTSLPQNLVTIPLRACCPDCIHTTEECLQMGELWQEKFSRGARRRRSASLDASSPPSCSLDAASGSTLCSALGTASNHGSGIRRSVLAITVDEVDQRRKSLDLLNGVPPNLSFSHILDDPTPSPTRSGHGHDKDESTSSIASATSSASYFSDDPNATPYSSQRKSSPQTGTIAEEDEAELFPLPSPRRSPSNSPKPSPSPSPRVSPIPSPSSSTASLRPPPLIRSDSPSRDSLSGSAEGSEESAGSTRPYRRPGRGRDERGLLKPDAPPSSSVSQRQTSPLQREVSRRPSTGSSSAAAAAPPSIALRPSRRRRRRQ